MELEDNGIGDVIEGEDRVEIHGPFLIGNAEGLLSLRVLTADKQTRPGMSSGGGDDVDGLMFLGGGVMQKKQGDIKLRISILG